MHGDEPRRLQHDPQHRPEVVDRPAEAFDGVLDDIACDARMVVPELMPVVVEPSLLEQRARARLMQPRIVQDDQTRVGGQIAPHEVVARRVAQLIDDKVVGIAARPPGKIARVRLGKTVDRVGPSQPRDEAGAVRGNPRAGGRQR